MTAETSNGSSRRAATSAAITALHKHSTDPAGRATIGGRATLQTLMELSRAGELAKTDSVVRVSEPQQVLDVLNELSAVVRNETLNLLPGGPFPRQWLEQGVEEDLKMVERAPVRSIYTAATGRDADDYEVLSVYADAGYEIRIADDLPHRLVIFDRTCAVLPVRTDDLNRGALIVREPTMVASLCALYFSLWRQAKPLREFRANVSEAPSESDRAILLLMSTGITDEVACARLGVSLRTYRRQIAALLHKLGAKNRFQAGTRAVERGWL